MQSATAGAARAARHLLGRHRVDQVAVEQHPTGARLQQASERTQERRLAARVRADDNGDLAVGHLEVEVIDDDGVVVGEPYSVGLKARGRGVLAVH